MKKYLGMFKKNQKSCPLFPQNRKSVKTIWEEYDRLTDMFLFKEQGEIPYYFVKLYGYNAVISGYSGDKVSWRGVKLLKIPKYFPNLYRYFRIMRYAKYIDILCLMHINVENYLAMLSYRLAGGKGKIYLKCDLDQESKRKDGLDHLKWKNMYIYEKIFRILSKNLPTIYTVETKKAYERLSESFYGDLIQKNKLYLLPNGFDPVALDENNIIRKDINKKERIIITVGRLGTFQKNTELFLEILSKVNLKDWKVYLIGPQTDSFNDTINDFYVRNPDKRSSVYFTGAISQDELYEYYNRSRVFLLTSRDESFAFVLLEAAYMKNYLISTDVGVMSELLDTVNGFSIDPKDTAICQKMANELERIINLSDDELNKLNSFECNEEFTWESILKNNEGIQKLIR